MVGHDQREGYEAIGPVEAPDGLGLVAEFEYVRTRTQKPLKVPCPGPFTLAGRIRPGSVYTDRIDVAYALAEIVNRELKALVQAGVTFIQLDEPSYAVHSRAGSPEEFVRLFNHTVSGVEAKIGLHLCFGNYVGRPVAKRTYRPLFPHILDVHADQLALGSPTADSRTGAVAGVPQRQGAGGGRGGREELLHRDARRRGGAGAPRAQFAPPEKVTITPDCGFSQTARWAARAKLKAMVAGTQIVRAELGGA